MNSGQFWYIPDRELCFFYCDTSEDYQVISEVLPMQRPGLSIRYVELEAIILDREANVVHQLNPRASYIWSRFDGTTSIDDIIQSLVVEFQLDNVWS